MPSLTPQFDALAAVFSQVADALESNPGALEVMEDYRHDVQRGDLDLPRLRGFLQGLSAAGALPYEDYCEVDAVLSSAFVL